jgi:hypothetical protein
MRLINTSLPTTPWSTIMAVIPRRTTPTPLPLVPILVISLLNRIPIPQPSFNYSIPTNPSGRKRQIHTAPTNKRSTSHLCNSWTLPVRRCIYRELTRPHIIIFQLQVPFPKISICQPLSSLPALRTTPAVLNIILLRLPLFSLPPLMIFSKTVTSSPLPPSRPRLPPSSPAQNNRSAMSLLRSSPGRAFLIATILASWVLPLLTQRDGGEDGEGAHAVVGEGVRVGVDDIPRFRSVVSLRSPPMTAHPASSGAGLRTRLPHLIMLPHPPEAMTKGEMR